MSESEKALIEALAHLRTLRSFGGTLQQSRELASKALERIESILTLKKNILLTEKISDVRWK